MDSRMRTNLFLVGFVIELYFAVVSAHICTAEKRFDPTTNKLRWAVPRIERCFCQGLVVLGVFKSQTCSTIKEDDAKLFFIDDPTPLTNRKNWVPAILDDFLQRDECYINECGSNPCQNEAICHDRVGRYVCQCKKGYAGVHCEQVLAVWGSWSSWSQCITSSCDDVLMFRERTCLNAAFPAVPCEGGKSSELKDCSSGCRAYPLGMQDGTIQNYQITASSSLDNRYLPHKARLNHNTRWGPSGSSADEWIQVGFTTSVRIDGIQIQGNGETSYVKTVAIQTGDSVLSVANGYSQAFLANSDSTSVVTIMLPIPVCGRYLRIRPTDWVGGRSTLRFEVLGFRLTQCPSN